MVVLMRYAFMTFALLVVATTGPAKAGHYGADVASGSSRIGHGADVVSGFSRTGAQDTQIIEISAERFSFNPSEIRVKAGTQLEIRLTSEDTMHGFRILGTDIDLELPKRGRGVASVMFQPTAGRYTFECSRLCGAGHSFMRGVIIATE
jgi:cytochrome c oxidase subunit 2